MPTSSTDSQYTPKRFIVDEPGYDTETGIKGLGYSPDSGQNFYVQETTEGRVYRQTDGDRMWPFLVDKIKAVMSIKWDDITGKPTLVTSDELEKRLTELKLPTDLVHTADLTDYAKQADIVTVKATADSAKSKAETAQSTADANTKALAGKPDDLVQTTSVGSPVDYQTGITREIKAVSAIGLDRSDLHTSAKQGNTVWLTTKVWNGCARQTAEIMDSQRPMAFMRTGNGTTWYSWEVVTTW